MTYAVCHPIMANNVLSLCYFYTNAPVQVTHFSADNVQKCSVACSMQVYKRTIYYSDIFNFMQLIVLPTLNVKTNFPPLVNSYISKSSEIKRIMYNMHF